MTQQEQTDQFIEKYVRKDKGAYYFWRTLCIIPAYLFYRPVYQGKENIPESGAVILAANHIHLPDPAFVLLSTRRVVRFLAKKELHDSILGFMYRSANTIPVDRQHGARESLSAGEEALRRGEVIGIFPEGTRNKTLPGSLLPFKFGAVKMAKETSAPIVPMAYFSKGRPFLDPYRIVIGEAYHIDKDADLVEENEKLKNKIQELLNRSMEL